MSQEIVGRARGEPTVISYCKAHSYYEIQMPYGMYNVE